MDRFELIEKLEAFFTKCAEKNKPVAEFALKEAYPGDNSTSFIVQIKAPWIESQSVTASIDFLFDILWETTDVDTRQSVFSIQVFGEGPDRRYATEYATTPDQEYGELSS